MLVGPVQANGVTCLNVENAWQFSKVYKDQVDEDDNPTDAYIEWRDDGYKDSWAHRYPKGKGNIPLYSWWDENKLGYIEARKKIYIPLYGNAVKPTETFQRLVDEYQKYGELVLQDFDAYDHRKLGMGWKAVVNNPDRKMGHAFVLALMLEGII